MKESEREAVLLKREYELHVANVSNHYLAYAAIWAFSIGWLSFVSIDYLQTLMGIDNSWSALFLGYLLPLLWLIYMGLEPMLEERSIVRELADIQGDKNRAFRHDPFCTDQRVGATGACVGCQHVEAIREADRNDRT